MRAGDLPIGALGGDDAFVERNVHAYLANDAWPRDRRRHLSAGARCYQTSSRCVARFSVSRTALREAYSVLAAKGLIVARPKVGTRVRPKADWNMLDPEVLAWHLQAVPTEDFVADLYALRQMVEPAAAALAASGPRRATIDRIAAAYADMERFKDGAGDLIAADLRFHSAILEATGNHFIGALGSLIHAALLATFSSVGRAPRGSRMTACISIGRSSKLFATDCPNSRANGWRYCCVIPSRTCARACADAEPGLLPRSPPPRIVPRATSH